MVGRALVSRAIVYEQRHLHWDALSVTARDRAHMKGELDANFALQRAA